MNVDNNKILSVDSSIVPNSGPPRSNTEKLESIHKFNILRSWNDSLKDYIDGLNNQITTSNTDSSLIEHDNNTKLIKTNNKKWSNSNTSEVFRWKAFGARAHQTFGWHQFLRFHVNPKFFMRDKGVTLNYILRCKSARGRSHWG